MTWSRSASGRQRARRPETELSEARVFGRPEKVVFCPTQSVPAANLPAHFFLHPFSNISAKIESTSQN
jgi:hypothetical protein